MLAWERRGREASERKERGSVGLSEHHANSFKVPESASHRAEKCVKSTLFGWASRMGSSKLKALNLKFCEGSVWRVLNGNRRGSLQLWHLIGDGFADLERGGGRGRRGVADMEGIIALYNEEVVNELAIGH